MHFSDILANRGLDFYRYAPSFELISLPVKILINIVGIHNFDHPTISKIHYVNRVMYCVPLDARDRQLSDRKHFFRRTFLTPLGRNGRPRRKKRENQGNN